jgi:peptidoglycan hydrolase-like protein with peptidoglycan-binding domain
MPFLVVDGIKGPKTQAAIIKFQQVQVKAIHADGTVEPGKQTAKVLRLSDS